jgi:hypothetical protein
MLQQRIETLNALEFAFADALKSVRAELKVLKVKQLKLNQWLELQTQLLNDPDTADSLLGAQTQTQITPVVIEIAEPAIEPAELTPKIPDEIAVVWETNTTGYTLDSGGIKRHFEVERWDDMEALAIDLTTSDGKVIKSAWRTHAIRKNKHLQAIEKSRLPHFFEQIALMGYEVEETIKMGNIASFNVFKDGIYLGIIAFDFYLWFLGYSMALSKTYPTVIECLAALEDSIKAKADIGV